MAKYEISGIQWLPYHVSMKIWAKNPSEAAQIFKRELKQGQSGENGNIIRSPATEQGSKVKIEHLRKEERRP